MRASVVVPARNARATLGRTLEALAAQDAAFEFEVIVVDDASHDGTPDMAAAAGGPVRLVALTDAPRGPAAVRNLGVAEARGELIAFCDADCYPSRGWLAAGVRALERADLVQGKVLPEPGVRLGPFDRSLWVTGEAGLWETANLFVTRSMFERVGGFEECLDPVAGKALGEDVWFGWRAKRLGARSVFCDEALVHHAVFSRGAREYIAERRRCRHFPELAALMPELRESFLYRGWFLNRRSAAFDLALLGAAGAVGLRRGWPLLAARPYLRLVRDRARPNGRFHAGVAAADVAADVVTAGALLRGSLAARAPVL